MKSLTFDLLGSPLNGTNLIEASAGTGKTYTITGLFLRLVVEMKFSVDEILVVTFTEAATEELRDRIRTALRKAMESFYDNKTDDEFFISFVEKYRDTKDAIQLLKNAIRDFDQAAIFTIHGFCKRILDENSFESGSLFDTELVTDQKDFKQEIVQDFWRKHIYHESSLFVNFALQHNFTPDKLLNLVGTRIIQPDFKIIPPVAMPDPTADRVRETSDETAAEKDFQQAFFELRSAWRSAKPEIENILLNNENLSRSRYKKDNIPFWIDLMDDFLATDGKNPMLFDQFEKFTLTEIERSTKKNCPAPRHIFFELCEALKEQQEILIDIFEQRILGLKVKLFHFVGDELIKRKREQNIQSFDDLLLKVYHALQSPAGNELADTIRKKFKAALIDEFQDTDPVQYHIFKNIFSYQNQILFLIGDPKQAIYGFRGADIFAYMEAARQTASRFTLIQNWRAEPGLITAINHIFGSAKLPFIYSEIPFEPAKPADKKDQAYLKINNKLEPPFQLWYLDASLLGENEKLISKTSAREIIYHAVAAEISQLLNLSQQNKIFLDDKPLREQDIAVLVRRNSEAIMMQQALAELNIPGVLFSTTNLFDSYEAMEVQRVLASITEPNSEPLLRAALSTDMLGLTGEQIDALQDEESAWENWLIKFQKYHDIWSWRGFIQMFRCFLSEQSVLPRLMAFVNGERRCTNVLHLSEVLHQVSIDQKPGMTELLKWLSEQRDPRTPRLDEHQLRLESDENAVKLVTVHKSKGLEYPIVFCPFTWDGSKIKSSIDYFAFHDETDRRRLTLDLGSKNKEQNRVVAEQELLAENLRLLYVALTRARHCCYLVWGRFNEAETSAPAYLFHQPKTENFDTLIEATSTKFKAMDDLAVIQELKNIADHAGQSIKLSHIDIQPGQKYTPDSRSAMTLSFQPFRGSIDTSWRISSYSSLISRIFYAAEIADHDEVAETTDIEAASIFQPEIQKPFSSIFLFPSGNRAGIFFHKIFELIDFQDQDFTTTDEIIVNTLKEFGFDLQWQPAVADTVKKVLSLPLDPQRENFRLSEIHNHQRLNELEFYFPLQIISPQRLTMVFNKFSKIQFSDRLPDPIGRLNFSPLRGFMKGFIDLVFKYGNQYYLIDWKSNLLGERIENYHQDRLNWVMANEFYHLQYLIYSVALNQYLKHRLPDYDYEQNFGGIYYIFLRGVDPERGHDYGIFRDKPPVEFINELGKVLIG